MPISIKEFDDKKEIMPRKDLVIELLNILKNNQDKAYCLLDLQNEFKVNYNTLAKAFKTLKRQIPDDIEWKWYHISGSRMLFFHYKRGVRKVKNDNKK